MKWSRRLAVAVCVFMGAGILCGCITGDKTVAVSPPVTDGAVSIVVVNPDIEGYVMLVVEYPTPAADGLEEELAILVNGEEVGYNDAGSGGGSGRIRRTLTIRPFGDGDKTITAIITRGETVIARGSTTVSYSPSSAILPKWIDQELFFVRPMLRIDLRLLADVAVTVNGTIVNYGYEKYLDPDMLMTTIVIDEPPLVAGLNRVEITGTSPRGEQLIEERSLYLAEGKRVQLGDTFRIIYGRSGSRSGPFYYISLSSDALKLVETTEAADGSLIAELAAETSGEVTVRVDVKHHFQGVTELDHEFTLEVR